MTVPLTILAGLSLVGGFVGVPAVISLGLPNVLERWLEPVLGEGAGATHGAATHGSVAAAAQAASSHGAHAAGLEIGLMGVSVLVALAGIALGWLLYERSPSLPERIVARLRPVYLLVRGTYFVDELYARVVLAPYAFLCRACAWLDRWIVDGAVNAAGWLTLGSSHASVGFDTAVVDGLVNLSGRIVRGGSQALRTVQNGVVQSYATAMVLGLFIMASVYLIWTGY
jgi:NADH-quinone oxidoreductase subunit L